MATRLIFILSLILIGYGYLCRIFHVNFFWESKDIGWGLFFIGIILLLFQRLRKKREGAKKWVEKLGIFILCFVLLMQIILLVILNNSEATQVAKNHLTVNERIVSEVGEIKSFFVVPQGSISVTSDQSGETGVADIKLVVKGAEKYLDVTVLLNKNPDTQWEVLDVKF